MFCSKCGAQIPEGSLFCEKCGARIDETPQLQNQQPQPQMQYQQQNTVQQPQTAQPSKKNNLPFLIGGAVVVLVLLVIMIPRLKKDDREDDYASNPKINSVEGNKDSGSSGSNLLELPGSEQTPSSPANNSAVKVGSAESYSTDALPTEGDFAWFYDDFFDDGESDGDGKGNTVSISDASLLNGGWKVTIYREGDSEDVYRKEFQHFNVTVTGNKIEADVKWSGLIENGGAWQDASEASPNHYTGTVEKSEKGALIVDMSDYYGNNIYLMVFWADDKGEYAYGWYTAKYGSEELDSSGNVAFCRP